MKDIINIEISAYSDEQFKQAELMLFGMKLEQPVKALILKYIRPNEIVYYYYDTVEIDGKYYIKTED